MNFNSELVLNEKALSGMKTVAIEFARDCVMACSRHYAFDGEEAVKLLGLLNPTVKSKITKEKRVVDKPRFTFPYNGDRNESVCQGLILNGGLFTQCEMSKKTQLYCGKCSKQAEKNSHGAPNYGTIIDRNSVGIMDYIDPTGKTPVPYLKFIKKKKWDLTEVQAEAEKYSININDIHFVEETSTKKRGRKPRVRSQVAYDTDEESEDIFDTIIDKQTNDIADENPDMNISNDDNDDDDISAQFTKLDVKSVVVEEVAPPQQAPAPVLQVTETQISDDPPGQEMFVADDLEEDHEEKEEAPKEPLKKSEKKSDKSEKLKQKEIEKQKKLDEKNAALAAKEIEKKNKEEAKAAKAIETSNSKNSKSNVSKTSSNSTEKTPSNTKADMFCKKGKEPCIAVAPAPQANPPTPTPKKTDKASVSVKPFTHNGVKYYKSPDDILYDKNGNAQGKWDESTKTITPCNEDEDEEEEDEEEDDDNSEEEEEEYEEEEQGSARYASKNSDLLDEIEYYECLDSN